MANPDPADSWIRRLIDEPVLFDTMVVRHLCAAGGGSVLGDAFAGRLVWPEAVQAELSLQSRSVREVARFLRDAKVTVLEAKLEDEQEVEDLRVDMYTRSAARVSDTQHLGEAQCLYFAERDGYPLVTHDAKARDRARVIGVDLFQLIDVLCVCVRVGAIKPGRAWDLYVAAVSSGLFVLPGFDIPGARERFLTTAAALRALALEARRGLA